MDWHLLHLNSNQMTYFIPCENCYKIIDAQSFQPLNSIVISHLSRSLYQKFRESKSYHLSGESAVISFHPTIQQICWIKREGLLVVDVLTNEGSWTLHCMMTWHLRWQGKYSLEPFMQLNLNIITRGMNARSVNQVKAFFVMRCLLS